MISVIICSVSPSFLVQVQNNIRKTIGVKYEVLFYNNSIDPRGICEVYNLLAEKAKYPFLCFVHEDVLFNTANWGQVIIDLFKNPEVGVIGVAGSKYKSKYYSGWYTGVKEFDCENIIHEDRSSEVRNLINLNPDRTKKKQEVVCVDGVLMCIRKNVWKKILFNEKELKGFHFYDIDFSLRAAALYKVLVTYEIEMIHLTYGGDFGNIWLEEAIKWHRKSKLALPFTKKTRIDEHTTDIRIINTWLDWLKNQNISFANKIQWVYLQRLYRLPKLYYSIVKFFLYKPFKLKYLHRLVK